MLAFRYAKNFEFRVDNPRSKDLAIGSEIAAAADRVQARRNGAKLTIDYGWPAERAISSNCCSAP